MQRYCYFFTELKYVLWTNYLFQDNSFILKPHIAPNWFLGSKVETSSDRPKIRLQISANHSQMIPILLSMVLDMLIWRHHGSQNVYKSFPGRPISNLIDFGRELCLFGGHVASRWISERVIHKCIIQNHYSLFFHRRAQTAPKSLFR